MAKWTDEERERGLEMLRPMLPVGSKVWTNITHVARSGMSRSVQCLVVKDGEIVDVSAWVARAINQPYDLRWGGVRVSGCGMDMTFHVVYLLSLAMHGCEGTTDEWSPLPPTPEAFRPGYSLTRVHLGG